MRLLSDVLGAEIRGLNLAFPLDDDTFAAVHWAHVENLILVFPD
jgi:alpha-ketoglutarate-dependent taurine dioxygenase